MVECTKQQVQELMAAILAHVELAKIKIGGGYSQVHEEEPDDGERP